MHIGQKWAVAAAAVVAGAAWLVVPAVSASAAANDTVTTLPIGGFGAILVDNTNHHVYVSGGGGTRPGSGIAVLDPYGNLQQKIDLPAADGMVLSPDGSTLYVAVAAFNTIGGAITAIDTSTFAVKQTWQAPGLCVTEPALAGDRIYFSYGCLDEGGGLGALDMSTSTWTYGQWNLQPKGNGGPLSIHGDKLVTGNTQTLLYDISSGSPVLVKTATDPCTSGVQRLSADGESILVAPFCMDHNAIALSATDLSVTRTFQPSVSQYPYGITESADGSTVAVSNNNIPETVFVDAADGSTLRQYDLPPGEAGFRSNVALNKNGTIAYAVTRLSNVYRLHTFADAAPTPTLTISGPATVKAGTPVTLTGTFGGGAGKALTVSRTDLAGRTDLPAVTTSDDGTFTVTDTPANGGDSVYTVSFAGDDTWAPAQATATVTVPRQTTKVHLSVNKTHWAYDPYATPQLTATVDGTTGEVCFSTPNLGKFICTDTDAQGVATAGLSPFTQNETVTATFNGNAQYAPATSKSITVTQAADVESSLTGAYDSDGTYALYHSASDVSLPVIVNPYRPGANILVTEQALVDGTWTTIGSQPVTLDGNSQATGTAFGDLAADQPYRIRASFVADDTNAAANGPWYRFKIKN